MNTAVAGVLLAIAVAMVGMSFAAVPLYRLFCAATGYGGTPKIGGEAPVATASDASPARTVGIRFNADTHPGLAWDFAPDQREMRVPLGEEQLATFHAANRTDASIRGVASYNITPEKAAVYFHKIACFCFNAQTLAARQRVEMPVSFWVDPAIATDPATRDVDVITLSYTFFRALDDPGLPGSSETHAELAR
jgi:cytochrome c oxidase assembly protein subunit 11